MSNESTVVWLDAAREALADRCADADDPAQELHQHGMCSYDCHYCNLESQLKEQMMQHLDDLDGDWFDKWVDDVT